MSVYTDLKKIKVIKKHTLNAISAKNSDIAENTSFKDYAQKIAEIKSIFVS